MSFGDKRFKRGVVNSAQVAQMGFWWRIAVKLKSFSPPQPKFPSHDFIPQSRMADTRYSCRDRMFGKVFV